ncbi:MAG: hypothetical protein JO344_03060, partial [Planctomycetaceae bacterium]|nr:hypothetical protein [Planctomycetaceae bacterium]
MSSQAARLGLDQSDQSKAIVVKVAAVLNPRIASGRISIHMVAAAAARVLLLA